MTSRRLLTGGRRVAAADFHIDRPVTLDGDAAYLDEGTALDAVRGYRPNFHRGQVVVVRGTD